MTNKNATTLMLYLFAVLLGSQIFKVIVANAVPGMSDLPTLGWNVDVSAALFTAALILVIEGDDKRAEQCVNTILLLGLLGTALGFSGYMQQEDRALARESLKHVFLCTAQGLIHAIVLTMLQAGINRVRDDSARDPGPRRGP